MKPTLIALLGAAAVSAVAVPPVLAQPGGPRGPAPVGPEMGGHDIRGQLDTLERRIQDGDRDHSIDRGEFDRATRELGSIRDQERNMRLRNHGDLNEVDRGMLQQRLDQLSRSIHWMRTNGPGPGPIPAPPPPPHAGFGPPPPGGMWSLDRREDWLQQRINHGRDDGSLNRREAFRAQRALDDIKRQQLGMQRRGGGSLSAPDRIFLQDRLDRLRDSIHWMRDNGDRAPWMP